MSIAADIRAGENSQRKDAAKSSVETTRVASIDVFRGLVMFLMLAEVLRLAKTAESFADSETWRFIAMHTSHVDWTGCSLHDLIQPSFSFLVGAALPFSLAVRRARGQSLLRMSFHAAWRAILLVLLGVFLRSIGQRQTNFTFEDTLSQIGLGYMFLFVLGFYSQSVQWTAFVVIVVGYWAAFALYPLPAADFDYAAVSVRSNWPNHFDGFMAHWNKNSNLAWAFDTWFLNLFRRARPFLANGGGYATLSFIPTLGTMILGLIAGGWMRNGWSPARRTATLVLAGLAGIGLGLAAEYFGVCPIVKRIWTPAWTLYSGGWCFLILVAFYVVCDVAGFKWWAFPLIVIGANSIFVYFIHELFKPFIVDSFKTHLGQNVFKVFGPEFEMLASGAAVLLVFWLMLFWMYRNRVFMRI